MELNQWHSQTETNVDLLTELDRLVTRLRDLDSQITAVSKSKKILDDEYNLLENTLIETLKSVNKDDYSVKGVARIKIMNRQSVQTPKTAADKTAFLGYISAKYGMEMVDNYISINSRTLNSFYNAEFEEAEDKAGFKIDGIGAPVTNQYIRFLT